MKHYVVGALLCLIVACASAQTDPERALTQGEMARYARLLAPEAGASAASPWFDVTAYELRLRVIPSPSYLTGTVRVRGIVGADGADSVVLDLAAPMTVDYALVDGAAAAVTRGGDAFTVALGRPYAAGESVEITVAYEGTPLSTGFGSFEFSTSGGSPWIWSLSEPYGAKDWWPCKDVPGDKADSVDLYVTVPSALRVGANGTLRAVTDNGDGTATHHWHEGYPIATYLVSVAIANYATFSNWFVYSPTDSMEVLHYVLPSHLAAAQAALPRTVDMLRIFSELYGPYPFLREKYGHADFGKGGAMEHQTMTSTSTYSESTISHELAHQWFGDLVTCRTWPHLWLNEGFAQYGTALYYERRYGTANYWAYMTTQMTVARNAAGPLVLTDTSSVNAMFATGRVYAKGATLLHMLRHVLGDTLFFGAIRAYAADSALAYGTATTDDLQRVCEAVSGRMLGWFFDEWAYGESSPEYTVSWQAEDTTDGAVLSLTLFQSTGTSHPVFFTMPLDVRVSDARGDTLLHVWNDRQEQTFRWLLPRRPTAVVVDPDNWVLKTTQLVVAADEPPRSPATFRLGANYPNPFNGETTIPFSLAERGMVRIELWNAAGERVALLMDDIVSPGEHQVVWRSRDAASGTYIARATFTALDGSTHRASAQKTLLLK